MNQKFSLTRLKSMTLPTNIDSHQQVNPICYPNPANSTISINLPATNISIFDMQGRLVLTNDTPNSIVDISTLRAGLYLIRITTKDKVYIEKLIKK